MNSFEIQKWAEYAIKRAKENFGQNLDYSETSLESLDSLIERAHKRIKQLAKDGNLSNDNLEKTILMWGSFLGELLRRECGGNWIVEETNIFLSIDNFITNPFEQVRMQIMNGSLYDAEGYYRNVSSHHFFYLQTTSILEVTNIGLGILNDFFDNFPQVNAWIVAINKVRNLTLLALQFPSNDINLLLPYSEKLRDLVLGMLIVGENTVETMDDNFSSALKTFMLIPLREQIYPSLIASHQLNQKLYQASEKFARLRSATSDIKLYKTDEILKSGRFTAEERKVEYRRRGKSPSGVIDGVYNDMNLEDGKSYNDVNRDWEADA